MGSDARPVILVVDDEPLVCRFVADCLAREGVEVECAANGREALQNVQRWRPALILLDLHMPIMNGWEFARAYRHVPGAHASIVVMTSDPDAVLQAVMLGAAGHLGKPLNGANVREAIARHARGLAQPERAA